MRILLLIIIISSFNSSFSQTKEILTPFSNKLKTLQTSTIPTINLPSFNLEQVLEDEYQNRLNKSGMYMFGYEHQTNINFFTNSSSIDLPNDAKLYLLKVKSENAISINVIFNDFFIPEGARLHVYDKDKSTIVGAYTSDNNNANDILGTELIIGEEMTIEYYAPKGTKAKSKLNIGTVIHGFEDINNWYGHAKINESGGCNLDVVCPDGIPWNNEIRSVARILNGGGLCTGSLVNNTAKDGKPYFLTANHCNPQSMASAVFRFNYESPTCGSQTSANSQNAVTNNTINGSSFKARNAGSDFGLIELNSIPPADYNIYYSGWNNSGDIPQKTVGIHHPSGDLKKLAFDDDAPGSSTYGTSVTNGEWRIYRWDRNTTTEGGSSGSGLWDENRLIVGQLHGGAANCGNSINDYYGKLSVSWNGTSATNRLKDWLDPSNSGVTTLSGYDPNVLQQDVNLVSIISPDSINCGNSVAPKVLIRNDGQETLTSLDFNYGNNGNLGAYYTWQGNLETGDTTIIFLPNIGGLFEGTNTTNINITNPNNGTDGDLTDNQLSVSFNNNKDCYAYPNPFNEQLIINFEVEKTNNKPVGITITDVQGKLIWSTNYDPQVASKLAINTSQIATGSYLLKIDYERQSSVQKLIKF